MENRQAYSRIMVRYHLRILDEFGAEILDDRIWSLLKAVDECASLRAAAARCEISYRKAWGDMRKTEQMLGFPLLEKHRGGSRGGESRLTDAGKEFVEAYRALLLEFESSVQRPIIRFKRRLKGKDKETSLAPVN